LVYAEVCIVFQFEIFANIFSAGEFGFL